MGKKWINMAADGFAKEWESKSGKEKQETQLFWIGLLQRVYGMEMALDVIQFEKPVSIDGHNKYIDAYIPETRVLIEQKSADVDLDEAEGQSGGAKLTPFEQAKRYSDWMPLSEKPRWIVVCNFREIRIYDMEHPTMPYERVWIKDLGTEYRRLNFLFDKMETRVTRQKEMSEEAGRIVGRLYDALRKSYANPDAKETLESLNILCVRIVFLLYAEDANLLYSDKYLSDPEKNAKQNGAQFHDYMESFRTENMRNGLRDLFKMLNTPYEERDEDEREDLLDFAYVNGGLFSEKYNVRIPQFTEESRAVLLEECSEGFDWTGISPTVFGAVFESTLDPQTRRKGGMHYTSPENIHRAIDSLFLEELIREKDGICRERSAAVMLGRLMEFQEKIGGLRFLDPACGSGNFLTETYTSLRRLENEVLRRIKAEEKILGSRYATDDPACRFAPYGVTERVTASRWDGAEGKNDPIKVKLSNFYGIEINDFAVTVAKTALWIAELQMKKETELILMQSADYFPIKSYSHIKEGNALHIDWTTFEAVGSLFNEDADNVESEPRVYDYIIGNPPFVGARFMTKSQKEEIKDIFGAKYPNVGNLDYVCGWFKKAANIAKYGKTRCALVSTNSITQGSHPNDLWKPIFKDGVHIDFAWRTFKWQSESKKEAIVYVVIIGFSAMERSKVIYTKSGPIEMKNINAYLEDAPSIAVGSRNKPICNVPEIGIGNQLIDGGYYLFTKDEMKEFVKKEPKSKNYFHEFYGAEEFLHGNPRYCLWLGDTDMSVIETMPKCLERVECVRKMRKASKRPSTNKLADKPTTFQTVNMPKTDYIVIPETSSENREYVPIGFMSPDVICSSLVKIIPNATLYHFGVLTSRVHMAWMRSVCGRQGMTYRYSKDIVYNNFVWPTIQTMQHGVETQNFASLQGAGQCGVETGHAPSLQGGMDVATLTTPHVATLHTGLPIESPLRGGMAVEKTAQGILDVRAKYAGKSLAELYNRATMPADLLEAHRRNDEVVMGMYGFDVGMTEEEVVGRLMGMYELRIKN